MNEVKMIQYFDQRYYRRVIGRETSEPEVKWYPSVTTKLSVVDKPGLTRWFGELGSREAEMRIYEAQNRGSRIHRAWQIYQEGGSIGFWRWQTGEEKPEADFILQDQGEYLDFLKLHYFTEEVKPEFKGTEYILYSDKYLEAGTCDNILGIKEGNYKINGQKPLKLEAGTYIADLKSGNLYDEAYMQLAAYASMYQEMGLVAAYGELKGALILHTKASIKTGIVGFGVKIRTMEELQEDFRDFRAVSVIWERSNKNKAPIDLTFPQITRRV